MTTADSMEQFLHAENHTKFKSERFAELVDENYLGAMLVYADKTSNEEIDEIIRSFKMLDEEPYKDTTITFYTPSRGYMGEILEKFVLEAHQFGIFVHLKQTVYMFNKIKEQVDSELQILTMYMLSAGFYVWLVTVAVACLVFIGEHVVYYIERKIEARVMRNFIWHD